MTSYSYEDFITAKDLFTEKVKASDIIGKSGWFLDRFPSDFTFLEGKKKSVLTRINTDSEYPFLSGNIGFMMFIPEKNPSYNENQTEWVFRNEIEIGDFVKIIDFPKDEDFDVYSVQDLIGTIGEIGAIQRDGIAVFTPDKKDYHLWPYPCLEKVGNSDELKGKERNKTEYKPFDFRDPKDRDAVRGKWVRFISEIGFIHEFQIVRFRSVGDRVYAVPDEGVGYSGIQLYKSFVFLDGTPVGKRV